MNSRKVYILILNWNNPEDTINCLESIYKIKYPNYQIVLIDNGSTDSSIERIVSWGRGNAKDILTLSREVAESGKVFTDKAWEELPSEKKLLIIKNNENLGFAAGNNVGIRYGLSADADYILLLNNDTLVSPDFLNYLVETAESDGNTGIVGAKIYDYFKRNRIQYAGGYLSKIRCMGITEGSGENDEGQFEGIKDASFITGCCMLISRSVFEAVGLLPEEYFMYLEDADFCTSVGQAGFLLKVDMRAKIYHKTGGLTPFNVFYRERNRLIYADKYGLDRFSFKLFFLLSRVVRIVQYAIQGNPKLSKALINGIRAGNTWIGNRLKIFYDGRTIRKGKTGVGVYAKNLLFALTEISKTRLNVLLLEDIQDAKNIIPIKTNISYESHPVGDLWEIFLLPIYLKKKKVKVFHSPTFHLPLFTPGIKKVVTIHDLVMYKYPYTLPTAFRIYSRIHTMISAKLSDAIIVSSAVTKKDVVEAFKIDENKVHVIHGAAADTFRPIKEISLLEGTRVKYNLPQKYILFVGSIEPRKNLYRLIQSYYDLRRNKKIEQKLVICGGKGWLKEYERILKLINEMDIVKDVVFPGYIPDEELPAIYNMADLFVYPSLYEGFGLSPLEAMSCGCPVIASNTSSIPEVVGDAAIMVNPEDIEGLADAMYRVLTNNELRLKMKKQGLERANKFSWKRCAAETLEVYKNLNRA